MQQSYLPAFSNSTTLNIKVLLMESLKNLHVPFIRSTLFHSKAYHMHKLFVKSKINTPTWETGLKCCALYQLRRLHMYRCGIIKRGAKTRIGDLMFREGFRYCGQTIVRFCQVFLIAECTWKILEKIMININIDQKTCSSNNFISLSEFFQVLEVVERSLLSCSNLSYNAMQSPESRKVCKA